MSQQIMLLSSPADEEALRPILEQLRAKGVRVSEGEAPKKDDIVLAALTESFYADEKLTKRLLDLIGAGAKYVLPLQLTAEAVPARIKDALYSRNIIPAQGRDAGQIAQRVIDALPKRNIRLPLLLTAAAVIIAAVAGLLLWRSRAPQESVPAMAAEPQKLDVPLPEGVTAEELEGIVDVVIVGDRLKMFTEDARREYGDLPDEYFFANYDFESDGWYSTEDGSRLAAARYDDLRFIGYMPNLQRLQMVLVEADAAALPDLSDAVFLERVTIQSCAIPDLDWLSGAAVKHLNVQYTPLEDFGPLTACRQLSRVSIGMDHTSVQADFSAFAPPRLLALELNSVNLDGTLDLSALSGCASLSEIEFRDLPLADLDCLRGLEKLVTLRVVDCRSLRDVSALGELPKLQDLALDDCPAIRDYSPVGQCKALRSVMLYAGWDVRLRDASFLGELPALESIALYSVDLADLGFLTRLSQYRASLDFSFSGDVRDYSALSAFKIYNGLDLEPYNGDVDRILPYLEGAVVSRLSIRWARNLDLSALPAVNSRLTLNECDLTDLSAMPEDFNALHLDLLWCDRLRSLDGLQNQKKLGNGLGDLYLEGCSRLTDWSALEGTDWASLEIVGSFTLPDFSKIGVTTLRLENIADLTDLECLSGLDSSRSYNLYLILPEAQSLTPVRRLHGVDLAVPPQLAEQAQELVDQGKFYSFRVEYPQGGWSVDDLEITLESLDELSTLPNAMLRRVRRLCLAGDELIDPDQYDVWDDYEDNHPTAVLHDKQTDTETHIPLGGIAELEAFYSLTGLQTLCIAAQPITNLNGLQALSALDFIELRCCPELTDVSPLFAMQSLSQVCLRGCSGVTSIQGIQNLPHLTRLDIFRVPVSDLSPLAGCDLSAAEEQGGFWLEMDDNPVTDFSALETISHFSYLCLNNMDCELWLPCLRDARIDGFSGCGCGFTADSLARFVSDHPELRDISIPWNDDMIDLTPLLSLENLERVCVSDNMEKAVASLEGHDFSFTLEIKG